MSLSRSVHKLAENLAGADRLHKAFENGVGDGAH